MEPLCRLLVVVFIPSVCFHGAAVQSSPINCQSGSLEELGPFDENYLGDVEELTGVPAGENLQLVEYLFQGHVDFLELIFTPGNSSATVKTKKPLDADTQPLTEGSLYYSVMCLSTNLKNSRVLHITDLNDHRPVFEKKEHQTSISESLPVGSSVLKVTAKDADATSANNRVTYRFLPPAPSNFELRYDGTIQLARSLDYNIAKVYSFTVEAQDPKGLYDTTTVNVTVEDFDNMNPSFNHNVYHAAVMENEAGPVLNILPEAIEAKDGDMGINQSVVYSISTVSPGKYLSNFNMDPNSGVITMGTGLDREEVDVVVINIKAAQQDVPQKTADATVFVKVEDVNDNPPQFGKDNYNFSVFENLPAGALLFILDVTDADEAGFSEGFFIVNSDMFSINKHGVVLLNSNASLDRETQDMYILKVVAVDSPNSSFSTTAQLNITILDINDNNPQFSTLPDTAYIAEGDYSPTSPAEVCHISVYDLDYGDNGRVTLSIATLEPNVSFVIQENGTLLAVGPLDRETKDIYELVIVATDHGTPENMNVTVVEVRISDINDHDPEFSQEIYSKSLLLREAVEGSHVLTLSASDKDADNNSLITYSFSTDCPLLKLDGKTGNITLGTGLSHIVNDTLLNLTAEAHDHGLPSRSSTATILVYLLNSSLTGALAFEHGLYRFSVLENEASKTEVGWVKAETDSSVVSVTYALQTHKDTFSVDKEGRICTEQSLNREVQEWYTLTVEAVDSRTPPNTAFTTVTVQVEDVNEPPEFSSPSHSVKVLSITPYRHIVLQVQASDPDFGEWGELRYSLQEPGKQFDVRPSTGDVYVVSLEGQEGHVTLQLKATDCNGEGLSTTTRVEVDIIQSSPSDTVTISLNQPVNVVDSLVPSVEESLTQVLGWRVNVIQVWSTNTFSKEVRSPMEGEKTYVSFVASDLSSNTVITLNQVQRKLQEEQERVTAHLEMIFGKGVQYNVVNWGPKNDNRAALIVLGVLLALSIMGLVVQTAFHFIRNRNKKTGSTSRGGSENNLILEDKIHGTHGGKQEQNMAMNIEARWSSLEQPPILSSTNKEDNPTFTERRTSLDSPPFLNCSHAEDNHTPAVKL